VRDSRRISEFRVVPYALALRRRWVTARGALDRREGFLIGLRAGEGPRGFGDCAPLETAGTESLSQAHARLAQLAEASRNWLLHDLSAAVSKWLGTPAARCAVETALLDIQSQLAGLPISRCLSGAAGDVVYVNAAGGGLDQDCMQRCLSAVAQGYTVIKLKVAQDSIKREINKLIDITNVLPSNVVLRLDANRGWNLGEAAQLVEALRDAPIDSLEEPLRNPSREDLRALQARVSWPVALDESIPLWTRSEWLSDPPARRVVCKPAVHGGLKETLEFAQSLEAAGVQTVISTTLESAAGTWACVHLAAALNNGLAHGVGTSDWFVRNTGPPPPVNRASIKLAGRAGLGFVPYAASDLLIRRE
jgi:o-succinylbenzoate synthase